MPEPDAAGLPGAGLSGSPLADGLRDLLGAMLSTRRPAEVAGLPAGSLPSPSPASDAPVLPSAPARPDDEPPPAGPVAQSLDLVRRVQDGDNEAFGALYDRYLDLVHRYIRYRVGSPQLAEDLTSETFLRALRRIGTFSWQGSDVGAWFVTIARNLVADHYKSSRYRLELTTDDLSSTGCLPAAEGPEGEVLAGLRNAALLDAVRKLTSEQQECVVLRFLQGLSVAETARIMGRKDDAVKSLQYRAVRRLAAMLPDDLRDELGA